MKKLLKIEKSKLKKIIAGMLIIMFLLCIVLAKSEGDDRRLARDLVIAMENTWDKVDVDVDLKELSQDDIEEVLVTEYKCVKSFKKHDFKDKKLNKLVKRYIGDIKKCREIVNDTDPHKNFEKFWDSFMPIYEDKQLTLYKIYTGGYGMKVSNEKYQDRLNKFLAEGWLLSELDNVEFTSKKDKKNLTYSTEITNESGFDIDSCVIEVNAFNKKGKKIGVFSADLGDWKNGEKRTLNFYNVKKATYTYDVTWVNCNIK